MKLTLTAGSASELFAQACRAVLAVGSPTAPRGLPTIEVLGATLTLTDPRRRLVDVPPARVINPAFAAAEAAWILSGSDDPWIYAYNDRLADYADNGRLMGAYGPRLRRWHGTTDQLAHALRALSGDPGTRRAVIQLYDPEADARGHKDVPCTLGYRFFLREGQLHMHTTMRSQDLWLGFCYDWIAPASLEAAMSANCLLSYQIPVPYSGFPRTLSAAYHRSMSEASPRYTMIPSPSWRASHHRLPAILPEVDKLTLVQAVQRFRSSIIIGIALASDRTDGLRLLKPFRVADRGILDAAIGMMHQPADILMPARPDRHFKRIERKIGTQVIRNLPPDNPAREQIHDE